ncbi:MAG: hypothetical protein FVQ80_18950 [Planctomycetes bacterium]|nr:hypothetical protein [Planctomycetota bacterium]
MYSTEVKTTRYFREQVLRKRPYIRKEWCSRALKEYVRKQKQSNGRFRYWIYVKEIDRYLRLVTLEDGVTIHNAFPDRGFKKEQ